MGWIFNHEQTPINRREICRKHVSDKYEVLKDALVGSTWYAAIKNKETGEVFASIALTKIDNSDFCNFGVKWMDEECGPYHCDCPESILNLLSPTENEWALRWRKDCREAAKERKNKSILAAAPLGARLRVTLIGGDVVTVIKHAPAYQFKTWFLFNTSECRYVSKKRVRYAEYAEITNN